jgi:hypothetical protein
MDKLFDEDLLLGKGWTSHEQLRPLAYSTLADLVHHVRQHLNINVLAKAVYLFSKNVHDESLPTSIQVSCFLSVMFHVQHLDFILDNVLQTPAKPCRMYSSTQRFRDNNSKRLTDLYVESVYLEISHNCQIAVADYYAKMVSS